MPRIALLIMLLAGIVTVAAAQDDADAPAEVSADEAAPADDEPAEADAAEEAAEPPPADEYYQDVDDEDFRPSEDIPADQSIPFPADI